MLQRLVGRTIRRHFSTAKANPFLEKYKEKLNESSGLIMKPARASTRAGGTLRHTTPVQRSKKDISAFIKVEMVKDLPAEEIGKIWNVFFSQKEHCVSGSMSGSVYAKLRSRAHAYPTFILPLSRNEGFEFYLIQFEPENLSNVYFTSLADYQLLGPAEAKPHLSMTHYEDFKEDKDIVLMKGEILDPRISSADAQSLVNMMQIFYILSEKGSVRNDLLVQFHENPAEFSHQAVIDSILS